MERLSNSHFTNFYERVCGDQAENKVQKIKLFMGELKVHRIARGKKMMGCMLVWENCTKGTNLKDNYKSFN